MSGNLSIGDCVSVEAVVAADIVHNLMFCAGRQARLQILMDLHPSTPEDGLRVPSFHINYPAIQDELKTQSSVIQNDTIEDCLPFLTTKGARGLFDFNIHGILPLEREKHIEYLHYCLEIMPPEFTAYDAARPWIIYWSLTGLCLLGQDVSHYRPRYESNLN